MQVILLEDVKKLGKQGEIVEISDGYARNFVLPKKLGVEANSKNRNDLKLQKANADKIAKEQLEAAGGRSMSIRWMIKCSRPHLLLSRKNLTAHAILMTNMISACFRWMTPALWIFLYTAI